MELPKLIHAKISDNPTKEEVEKEIKRLKLIRLIQRNADKTLKIIINSIYGVAGYTRFICYHREVAQSITKQSEDIIKYTEKFINEYFDQVWPTDHEVHKALGVTKVMKPQSSTVIYMDTDSVFLALLKIYNGTDYNGEVKDFALKLYDLRLKGYIKQKLYDYCDHYGASRTKFDGSDSFKLELEQMAYNIIWVAKKKYMKELAWYKNIHYDRMKKAEIVGLETRQMTMPKYFRGKLKEAFRYLLSKDGKPDRQELAEICRSVRSQIELLHVEEICKTERVSKYTQNVINHTTALEYQKGARPPHKSAGLYNYLLYNSEFRSRYPFVESGDRIKYYHIKDKRHDVETFGFLQGEYPSEFAPAIDYDMQFQKLYLKPINNVLDALKVEKLDSDLSVMPHYW